MCVVVTVVVVITVVVDDVAAAVAVAVAAAVAAAAVPRHTGKSIWLFQIDGLRICQEHFFIRNCCCWFNSSCCPDILQFLTSNGAYK